MRKLKVILFASICIGGVFLYQSLLRPQQADNVMLENIEALAGSEGAQNMLCSLSGSIECPASGEKVKEVSTFSLNFEYE